MLNTALNHFTSDITRARGLHAHAVGLPAGIIRDDILRSSWMMAVGACDAYFSDAYADLISRALRAKELQPAITIPDRLNNLKVPVTAIIRPAGAGWRWRMAARELIESENVLSLEKIKHLFNHFFRKGHKLLSAETIAPWIIHPSAKRRHFGISPTQYRAEAPADQATARKDGLEKFEARFEDIFQRRHDCIYNCDRPKVALQAISEAHAKKAVEDIEFLVLRCHDSLLAEFPLYLSGLGFSVATRNQVCI